MAQLMMNQPPCLCWRLAQILAGLVVPSISAHIVPRTGSGGVGSSWRRATAVCRRFMDGCELEAVADLPLLSLGVSWLVGCMPVAGL
mmetsp:Transcript_15738/g.47761  ORF Transcript_15738/g.47761 Transcript_15738/m.47761 type:complete len:87 (+) Transcript_15738:1130-1390(+)